MLTIAPNNWPKFRLGCISYSLCHKCNSVTPFIPYFSKKKKKRLRLYYHSHRCWHINSHVINKPSSTDIHQHPGVSNNPIVFKQDGEWWVIEFTRVGKFSWAHNIGAFDNGLDLINGVVQGAQEGDVILSWDIVYKAWKEGFMWIYITSPMSPWIGKCSSYGISERGFGVVLSVGSSH